MTSKIKILDPRTVPVEITITMPLGDWEKLGKQLVQSSLGSSYPAWELIQRINGLIESLEKKHRVYPANGNLI